MYNEACILFLVLVLFLVGAALELRRNVRKMLASPEAKENVDAAERLMRSLPPGLQSFLNREGFRFVKAYAFHGINFGVWIRISAELPLRTFILYDKASKSVYEFTSDLAEGVGLTSTTGRSAFLFPLPFGCFMQSFPKANPDELWKAHLEGEVYIVEKLGIPLAGSEWPFLELIKRTTIRKMSYVTSRPFWPVHLVYRYFLKRFLLHNQPLWQQDIRHLYGKPGRW